MPLNLMFLTSFFSVNPEDIKEGVGYRYVGFYGSLTKALLRLSPESSVFWYSVVDHSFNVISKNGCENRKVSMISAVINAVSETFKKKSFLAVVVAYPWVLPRVHRIFEYVFALLIFRFSSIKRIKLIVDDFDPAVENAYDFSEAKPSLVAVAYLRILEKITLKLASSIIAIGEFWKRYMVRTYGLKESKILVISNGSLIRLVPHNFKESSSPLLVLYSGSARKVKDVDKLVLAIENLRSQGMALELHIAGAKLMDLPSWVHTTCSDWNSFVSNVLVNSDVCVLPYPPTKFTFLHSIPAKLFDYMAAGKPVISTNLKEVGDIIRSSNCGLVAKDWTEFEAHLKRLYEDRELATKLGNNGRAAAEKCFNYELLAEMFLENILKQFKVSARAKHEKDSSEI